MVMDDLPAVCFSVIDVCDAMVQGNLMSGKNSLTTLDANFVGKILGDLNYLINQFYVPLRGDLGNLLK